MQSFRSNGAETEFRGKIALYAQLASLLATGCVVWFVNLAPRMHRQTPASVILEALGYALLAWAWSAAITCGVFFVMLPAEDRVDMVRTALRTAKVAVWFAPATILLTRLSPAALAAALVLVITTTRLLYSEWRQLQPPPERPGTLASSPAGWFTGCQLPELSPRQLAPGLAVSLTLQAAVTATLMHYALAAGAMFAMSAALLTVYSMSSGAIGTGRPPSMPRPVLGVLMTVLLATGLTVGGSPGLLQGGHGWNVSLNWGRGAGAAATLRALLRQFFYGERPVAPTVATTQTGREAGAGAIPPAVNAAPVADTGAPGGFPGVILWPEVKPVATLVAPPPVTGGGVGGGFRSPYSIPFSGEYWMFRWPFSRPPRGSYFRRGSPTSMGFSTTDRTPLAMEAHHKLDTPIELRCCGGVQIEIRNADLYPGTVAMELMLLDTEHMRSRPQSLGKARVKSAVDPAKDPVVPVREVLEFAMPAAPALEQFDEFRVIFNRDRAPTEKSPKIAIDRFVLIPRGQ